MKCHKLVICVLHLQVLPILAILPRGGNSAGPLFRIVFIACADVHPTECKLVWDELPWLYVVVDRSFFFHSFVSDGVKFIRRVDRSHTKK